MSLRIVKFLSFVQITEKRLKSNKVKKNAANTANGGAATFSEHFNNLLGRALCVVFVDLFLFLFSFVAFVVWKIIRVYINKEILQCLQLSVFFLLYLDWSFAVSTVISNQEKKTKQILIAYLFYVDIFFFP